MFGARLSYSQGESNIIFYDDFNGHNYNWNIKRNNGAYAVIRNGVYYIHNTTANKLYSTGLQVFIDYSKNFVIETRIRKVSGKNNKGFGLLWGSKGLGNSFMFLITNNGYFMVGAQADNKFITLKKWTKTKAIKKDRFNRLRIEKEGLNMRFYINDQAVYSMNFMKFFGQFHGFVLQDGISVEADYLRITTDTREINLAGKTPFSGYKRIRLPATVNTKYSEIAPIISPDGNTLFFGRIYDPRNFGEEKECDIWYSEKKADGSWGEAKHAPKPLNNDGVNVVISVTPDGNSLFLEGLYNSDGSHKSEQGISISHKTENGWTVPKEVVIDDFYNKNEFESYTISDDQSVIVMSVERDDSYGDLDLYVSFRKPDGTYTKPKNLGATVNTFASESTPFLASDGKTLYFSSNGLPGYGSHDIFVTRRLDDSWTQWTKPQNLGKPINTYDWDTYLSIPAKGDFAYLSSAQNSIGNEDIFEIQLSKEQQPEPVVLVYGKVIDNETGKPLAATITYHNLETGDIVGIAHSDAKTGNYKITLPYGKIYDFVAEAENYISQSNNLDLRNSGGKYKEKKIDLYLFPLKTDAVIQLNNVFFKQAKADLEPESYAELDRLVDLLKNNPTMIIELRGHTDYRGNAEKLQKLSEERVKTVKNYLVLHGIKPTRIMTKAFGGTKPVYKGDDEEKHKLNRRVEFRIIKL